MILEAERAARGISAVATRTRWLEVEVGGWEVSGLREEEEEGEEGIEGVSVVR